MSDLLGRIESAESPRTGADRTDDELLAEMRKMAGRDGSSPSQYRVKKDLGIGSSRADKLLALLRTGPSLRVVTPEEISPIIEPPQPARVSVSPVPVRRPEPPKPVQPAPQERAVRVDAPSSTRTADQQRVDIAPPVEPAPIPAPEPVVIPQVEVEPEGRPVRRWPLIGLAAGAFVSIWAGWVGLGEMTGFGPVRLLPGIADQVVINTAITLPLGVECYAALAMRVMLSNRVGSSRTKRFAQKSFWGSLALGLLGQAMYHLMEAAGVKTAPWGITLFVSCIPVVVLGLGAGLFHMLGEEK